MVEKVIEVKLVKLVKWPYEQITVKMLFCPSSHSQDLLLSEKRFVVDNQNLVGNFTIKTGNPNCKMNKDETMLQWPALTVFYY